MNEVAKKLDIEKPQDWGNIPATLVMEYGGSRLLGKYGSSLNKTLATIYPGLNNTLFIFKEISWDPKWFKFCQRVPSSFWNISTNQKRFFDNIAEKNQISSPTDWLRVSTTLVQKSGGQVFGDSLLTVTGTPQEVSWIINQCFEGRISTVTTFCN